MINITKHVKISILTVILFVTGFFLNYPLMFYLTYAVMVLHEAAHMTAAMSMGLKIDSVALQPFGMNLKLKNRLIPSFSDEIILYLSGPLVNAFAAFVSAMVYIKYDIYAFKLFSMTNLALFIVNLLPAIPLDGGYIIKRILTQALGYRRAFKITYIISAVVCLALLIAGVYFIYNSRNFSVMLFALLLLGNNLTQKNKYYAEYTGEAARAYM